MCAVNFAHKCLPSDADVAQPMELAHQAHLEYNVNETQLLYANKKKKTKLAQVAQSVDTPHRFSGQFEAAAPHTVALPTTWMNIHVLSN